MAAEWTGSRKCDFCGREAKGVLYDAQTREGPWATMCRGCWKIHGTGELGIGRGQKYVEADGRMVCAEGGFDQAEAR